MKLASVGKGIDGPIMPPQSPLVPNTVSLRALKFSENPEVTSGKEFHGKNNGISINSLYNLFRNECSIINWKKHYKTQYDYLK